MPPKGKAAGKGRAPAKRKLAEEFPPGEVLTDTAKKSWKLGAPIGQGGFGLIYLGKKRWRAEGGMCVSAVWIIQTVHRALTHAQDSSTCNDQLCQLFKCIFCTLPAIIIIIIQ